MSMTTKGTPMMTQRTAATVEGVMAHADEVPPDEFGATVERNDYGGYDTLDRTGEVYISPLARICYDDGQIEVYRFEDNGVLAWSATFSSFTPLDAIAAVWQAARA